MCRFLTRLLLLFILAVGNAALTQIDGSGTTNPAKFFGKVIQTLEARFRGELRLTYRAVGSSTGQQEFSQASDGGVYTSGLTDFASGDIPMTQSMYDAMSSAGRNMVHIPFCLGAVGIFHSVPKGEVGNAGLRIPTCTLAKIFSGQITTWDHAEIKANNPSLAVPPGTKIQVAHRTLGSSSTAGTTGYLETCPGSWTLGSGSTVSWPTTSEFHPVQGSPGMTAYIQANQYAIGYLDAGHGHSAGLQEVQLQNLNGKWLTSLQAMSSGNGGSTNGIASAGAQTTFPTSATADWSGVNLYNKPGADTWPIVLVSYLYLNKDLSTVALDKVALIKAFVDLVLGEGQGWLPEFSFNSVPATMNTWTTIWANDILKPTGWTAANEYVFEASTDPWGGQAANVISSKRNSYSLMMLGEIRTSLDAMASRISSLETSLNDYGIVPLHGSGTTNPKNWFAKAMKLMEHRARAPMLLTYRAVGSSTGQTEFVGDASTSYKSYNHFGAGDIPMSASLYATLSSHSQTMVHLPFAAGAIGVFHSVPSGVVSQLKLSACLLAKIFSGIITSWDDSAIVAENPGMSAPAGTTIKVAHRTLGSSSTSGLAGYLNKKCPGDWSLGTSSSISWPSSAGSFNAVQGSPGMQEFIRDNTYAIGYLDAGHGHDFHLAEVALTNADGNTRTSKEAIALGGVADALTAAVNQNVFLSDASADWSGVNVYDMSGPNTWPIVLVSYMYVKKDQTQTNPKTAAALQAFITAILNNHDSLCAEFGFTELSPSVRSFSTTAASTIMYPSSMASFTFETSTDAKVGMGSNVISSNRFAFDDYERGVIRSDIAALQATLAASPAPNPAPAGDKDDDDESPVPIVIAIIAVVISIMSFGFSFCAYLKINKASGLTGANRDGQIIGNSNVA